MARGKNDFKVIIVGGSIAGLTLAHCLDKAGIDFVVLEARDEIAPQVGASIGILPNGARVFDQLGVWDDIEALIEPLSFLQVWTNANQLILESKHARLLESRMGYPTAFLDRQLVLRVLYDHLRQNDKVLVDKRAVSVQCSSNGVTVTCKDGSTYSGDMVAGADGVHSTIRNEMWRHIEKCGKQELIAKDMVALSAEYKCMFGISSPVPGLNIGTSHRAYNDDWSGLIIVGQAGRVFWFLFEKMDKRYWAPNIPRFSKSDADDFVNRFAKRHVAGNITFDALWATKITSTLVALEEAQYEHWSFDRFACLGDSIHKMTPNLGQGGNSAIESAAALSNSLCKLLEDTAGAKPSIDQVRQALQVYENKRQFRTAKICDTANTLTRLEAFVDLKHKIISKYIIPNSGDYLINLTCDNMIGATKLDFLPATPRSLQGTMPFDPNLGVGHEESRLSRALFALPLLGTLYFSRRILSETIGRTGPYIMNVMKAGAIATAHGPSIAVRSGFVGVSGIDKLLALYTTIFTPAISGIDPAQRLQMIGFMADLTPVQIIWTIEGLRRGNLMTFASLPTLFAIAYQFKGIGLVAPLYYFLHYVQSPQEKYHAADNRMVPKNFAKTVIPAVALGYVAPTVGMFLPFSIGTRQAINAVWQVFPATTAILHRIFSKTVVDTTDEDCHKNVTADVPYLRYAYAFGGCVSAAAYVYLWTRSPFSMSNLFFSGVSSPTAPVTSFSDGIGRFLKYDQLFAFSSGLYWEILHFKDLKKAGKMKTSWWKIIGVLGGTTFAFGPGAAMSLGWAWREEVMAARRAVKA